MKTPWRELGPALCEAFGIDSARVTRISLTIEASRLPQLDVTYVVLDDPDLGPLSETVKRYSVVERVD